MITIEVAIDHGRVTPVEPHILPEHGRGLLTVLGGSPSGFTIGKEAALGKREDFEQFLAAVPHSPPGESDALL